MRRHEVRKRDALVTRAKRLDSHLKVLVRARMDKTGESYEQALRHVRAQEEREALAARERRAAPPEDVPYLNSPERAASVADTAFAVAAVRAEEAARPLAERLFDDPYAALFAVSGAHVAEATQRFLDLPFLRDGVRLRTRYIDDAVREGLAAGLQQVVLLGAGFDARGLRLPEIAAGDVSVYEVDTSYQLARKRAVLRDAHVDVPPHVAHVAVDFHAASFEDELDAALEEKGFRPGEGAMFVWEGVIGYIDDAAIDRTLRYVVQRGGPGSRLVFTYAESNPDNVAGRAASAGFASCTEIDGNALWRRYLPGDPYPTAWVMKIGTATV